MICGWLSPSGQFTQCCHCEHIEAAIDILANRVNRLTVDLSGVGGAEAKLEKLGYIKMTGDERFYGSDNIIFYNEIGKGSKITSNQANWLLDNYYKLSLFQQEIAMELIEER